MGRAVTLEAQQHLALEGGREDFAVYETHHGSDPGYLRSLCLLSACPGDIAEVSLRSIVISVEELGQVK